MGAFRTASETELKRKLARASSGPHSTRAGADGLMMGARLRGRYGPAAFRPDPCK
jgi:hypothetical protein